MGCIHFGISHQMLGFGGANPMISLALAALGIVLVGAGLVWRKPRVDDYGEISD